MFTAVTSSQGLFLKNQITLENQIQLQFWADARTFAYD